MMSSSSKQEYLSSIRSRYQKGSKAEKIMILNEFTQVCLYHRKYAIRLLNTPEPQSPRTLPIRGRGRPKKYDHPEVLAFLKLLWIQGNLPCSKRLKAMIPLWLPHDSSGLSEHNKHLLLSMSSATIDRLLGPLRKRYTKVGLATTKPGSLIKKHIPITTGQWDERSPGFLEADTVAHCGTSIAGMYVFTVNTTDIATGWNEARATWGKGEQGVLQALTSIEAALPFALQGFDCDNGSEFLNWTIVKHFLHRKRPVKYTRSREYHKNDNAHIEGKNWTLIRQYFGYDRFDDKRMVALMNDLYTNQWRLLVNFFLPSMKLQSKHRVKSKSVKRYDTPLTPFQRLCLSKTLSPKTQAELGKLFKSLNPFMLQKIVSRKISDILRYASTTNNYVRASISQ